MGKIYNINGKYPNVDGKFEVNGGDMGFHSSVHQHPNQKDIDYQLNNGILLQDIKYKINGLEGQLLLKSDASHFHNNYIKGFDTKSGKATGDVQFTGDVTVTDITNGVSLSYTNVDTGTYTGYMNQNVQNQPSKAVRLQFTNAAGPTDGSSVLEFDYIPNN